MRQKQTFAVCTESQREFLAEKEIEESHAENTAQREEQKMKTHIYCSTTTVNLLP
jgi:hypothetical protein